MHDWIVTINLFLNGCVTIGIADNIDVFVTDKGVVIYELIFPVILQHPVMLRITYTSEAGASQSKLIPMEYNNTDTITYKETNGSPPPYPVYYVNISLVAENGNERLYGPPKMRSEKIGMYNYNIITSSMST